MGFIKTILSLAIVLAIVVFGYWLYATYTSPSAGNDRIWVTINSYMPEPLKKWSCDEIKARSASGTPAPATCEGL
jgi:hypothetical protein